MAVHAALAHRPQALVLAGDAHWVVVVATRAAHQARRLQRDMAIAALESAVLSGPDRKGKFMAARGQRTLTEAELKACGHEGRRPRGGSMARGTLFRKRRLPRRADMQWVDVRAAIVRNVTCVAIRGCAGKLSLRAALVALATIYERVHAREGKPRSPV